MVDVGSGDESQESVKEADFDVSSDNGSDMSPTEGDLPIIGIPQRIMSIERMHDFVSRYKISPGYIYRIPSNGEHMSTPGPLNFSTCEKSFRASFRFYRKAP